MQDRYVVIVAKFNELITRSLLEGALSAFHEQGVPQEQIDVIWVPGAFEIPVVAANAARSHRYAAVVTLGAVIRGETPHFDHVAGPTASSLMGIAVETGIPVIFGILTTDTVEQAMNRAGLKLGNKGTESAHAALKMSTIMKQIDGRSKNL
jgi:6,7-dimethyl-8-ribityllumazine synthase